jgi:hypothetical protein
MANAELESLVTVGAILVLMLLAGVSAYRRR